uniref:Uncharacterized protein n=1 Tax=Anguilla anguilla TaxID=7936 RepID=A0A0E9PH17_ANGAN
MSAIGHSVTHEGKIFSHRIVTVLLHKSNNSGLLRTHRSV